MFGSSRYDDDVWGERFGQEGRRVVAQVGWVAGLKGAQVAERGGHRCIRYMVGGLRVNGAVPRPFQRQVNSSACPAAPPEASSLPGSPIHRRQAETATPGRSTAMSW